MTGHSSRAIYMQSLRRLGGAAGLAPPPCGVSEQPLAHPEPLLPDWLSGDKLGSDWLPRSSLTPSPAPPAPSNTSVLMAPSPCIRPTPSTEAHSSSCTPGPRKTRGHMYMCAL